MIPSFMHLNIHTYDVKIPFYHHSHLWWCVCMFASWEHHHLSLVIIVTSLQKSVVIYFLNLLASLVSTLQIKAHRQAKYVYKNWTIHQLDLFVLTHQIMVGAKCSFIFLFVCVFCNHHLSYCIVSILLFSFTNKSYMDDQLFFPWWIHNLWINSTKVKVIFQGLHVTLGNHVLVY
jgi:hypothetical protein